MHDTWPLLRDSDFPRITRGRLQTLQLNLGYLCNLSCIHCHVAAGPRRTELMDRPTMALALAVAKRHDVGTLDVTGGSPEMNPDFRWFVEEISKAGYDQDQAMEILQTTLAEQPDFFNKKTPFDRVRQTAANRGREF